MSWSEGCDLFCQVWSRVLDYIPESERLQVCREVMGSFGDRDASLAGAVGISRWPEVQAVWREWYPK